MDFSVLSPAEVRWRYAKSTDKVFTFQALVDLTDCQPHELAEFLGVKAPERRKVEHPLGKGFDRKKNVVVDPEMVRKLYEEGLNDAEIAKRLGCSKSPVCTCRNRLGLPSKHKNAVVPVEQAKKLWAEGLNDGEIASRLGLMPKTIMAWRHRYGLDANYGNPRAKKVVMA